MATGTALTETLFPFLSGLTQDSRRELGALIPTRTNANKNLLKRGDVPGHATRVLPGDDWVAMVVFE